MSLRTLPFSLAGFGLALLAFAPAADAHIRLLDPLARYEITGNETGIKSCPCGLGQSLRAQCDLTVDASDPDRSTKVHQAEAGSTLTLRFEEYIGHSGTYRVAFDPDGADVADFNANILVPMVADPPGNTGNVNEADIWEIEVPLPDMTCDNCTLQLVQAMNGDMINPVADPGGTNSYYSCVDLQLMAPGSMGEPGGTATGGTNGMAAGGNMMGSGNGMTTGVGTVPQMGDTGSSNMNGSAMGNIMTGMGSLMPSTSNPGPMGTPAAMSSGDSGGGCSLGARTPASPFAALAAAGLVTLFASRRRNRK